MLGAVFAGPTHGQCLTTIPGVPLQINVGCDLSFQVFNSNIGGAGQIFPDFSTDLADMGVFVCTNQGLRAPDFASACRPGSATGALGVYTAWTPVACSGLTGNGTPATPYQVVVDVAGDNGLTLKMTVTYEDGDECFAIACDITTPNPLSYSMFVAGDLFLADSDDGVPVKPNCPEGSAGGKACDNPLYQILYVPQTPPDACSARHYNTIWGEIGACALSNLTDPGCIDNGAALQWDRVSPQGHTERIETLTCFGEIPCPGCEVTLDEVLCTLDPPGYLSVTATVANDSGFNANRILLTPLPIGGPITIVPDIIYQSIPDQSAGQFNTTIGGWTDGEEFCFIVTLIDEAGNTCCSSKVCFTPDCGCLQIPLAYESVTCDPVTGEFIYSFRFDNLFGGPVYHAFFYPSPPAVFDPDHWAFPGGIPPGGTSPVVTVRIKNANPGDTVCFDMSVHNENLDLCCSREHCVTLPARSGDCDGNGFLDIFDFLWFVNLFNSGDAGADCDGNGSLDLFDFMCFVDAFNSAC